MQRHHHENERPHRHHGRHGGGGHRGRGQDRMERGSLRYVLLDSLREGPRHGYEIIRMLEERTQGRYIPSPGTVYPTLQYLEELGLVSAHTEAERRIYAINDAGRAELESQAERVQAFWDRFAVPVTSESSQHEIDFIKEELDALAHTLWSGLREAAGGNDRETLRLARQSLQRCREEIRSLIAGELPGSDAVNTNEAQNHEPAN